MTENASVVAIAEPSRVQVSQIDKQLKTIWSAQEGATRASTFNLLVYESELQDPNSIGEAIGAIAVQHPCRAIALLASTDGPKDNLEAYVAAYCPVSEGGGRESICCEYITLRASGKALDELDTTAAALLLPELETFLWWKGPLNTHLELFTNLQHIVDRTVVDSSLFETPEKALESYTSLALGNEKSRSFGDLNWSRLTPWREETAVAFDSEGRAACLGALDRVIIEYGQSEGIPLNPCQAYLFLGWLASRLGWQPLSLHNKDLTKQIIMRDSTQRPIQVTLRAVAGEAHLAGQITSVGLRSEEMGAACSTVLCSSDSSSCIRMQMNVGEATLSLVSDIDTLTTEQLLSEALRTPDRDPIYEESLEVIHDLMQLK
ncbi:glucose-6-phosphate dehydrogenase assembly protein OpcA [Gloeobacter morelensis]|uniref:Glucose-6-phosphate dehydrogenase assembly protein OpcA n=1 Tax=Gloeobacter morelensis MG652769 TaxID=2781736 RepID=A0ABY3PQZ4_9CYAN|nr:glucose-6-phosphate dehydrogenase assembly protein OpcA [Gloeobacter morelensis]UFP96131.1 glucose-6-phosphate dehydrogenase assembly protein OpcA [Gloeobacter morelensis MG652769]